MAAAGADDRRFAHDLTRDNMAELYAAHGRTWDASIFDASWPRTENYVVLADGRRAGVLRLTEEGDALYVRDLQVAPEHQDRGAGTFAMQFAQRLAVERRLAWVRLRVFTDNRARFLYRRLGFRAVSGTEDGGLQLLEKRAE